MSGPDVTVKVGEGESHAAYRISGPLEVARTRGQLYELRRAWLAGSAATTEILARITDEYDRAVRSVLDIVSSSRLLADDEELAESLALRGPGLDALGYIQAELLRRKRAGPHAQDRAALTRAIQLTINGVAAGLRNTG